MLNRYQAKGHATKTARSNLRWQKVRDISDAGGTKDDAIKASGLTLGGLNTLLKKRTGSQKWPITTTPDQTNEVTRG